MKLKKFIGPSRNLYEKYTKILYDDNNKNDPDNESSILNKKNGNT